MRASLSLWAVLVGASACAWRLPRLAGFGHTGWLWVLIGSALVIPAVMRLYHLRGIRLYLVFLGYAGLSLMWINGSCGRSNVQDIVQLAAPILPWLTSQQRKPSGENPGTHAYVPLIPLCISLALVILPWVMQSATGASVASIRPASVTIALLAACFLGVPGPKRRHGLIGAALAFLFCFLAGSRTATFTILGLAALMPDDKQRWIRRVSVIVGVALLAVVCFHSERFQERFFLDGSGTIEDVISMQFNTSGRNTVWPELWYQARKSPFIGHGAGSAHAATFRVSPLVHPHNDYLRTFHDYGLLGLILFWGFFIYWWLVLGRHTFLRNGASSSGAAAQGFLALTAFFLLSVTDNLMLYTAHFMFPMFFVLGLSYQQIHGSSSTKHSRFLPVQRR